MECDRLAELLPWYLNETLALDERESLDRHLAECESCRRELHEARADFVLFGAHLPADALVAYVADQAGPTIPRDLIEGHLANCDRCAEELAWLRESREDLEAATPQGESDDRRILTFPGLAATPRPFWRWAALAASLATIFAGAGWLRSWQELAWLERRLAQRTAPEVNVAVVDLHPQELVVRGGGPSPGEVEVSTGGGVTLILNSGQGGDGPFRREIEGSSGELLHRLEGLRLHPGGGFTVALSLAELPRGWLTLKLYAEGAGEPVESYGFIHR